MSCWCWNSRFDPSRCLLSPVSQSLVRFTIQSGMPFSVGDSMISLSSSTSVSRRLPACFSASMPARLTAAFAKVVSTPLMSRKAYTMLFLPSTSLFPIRTMCWNSVMIGTQSVQEEE